MNAFDEEKNRQIIPRWLPWRDVCHQIPTEALDYTPLTTMVSDREYSKKRARWVQDHSRVSAADLVLTALLTDRLSDAEVAVALEHLQSLDLDSQGTLGIIAPWLQDWVQDSAVAQPRRDDSNPRVQVANLKASLVSRVRDPFLYLDLAYAYSLLGLSKKAEKNLEIALALAPNHPLILRSAAHFFLYTADKQQPDRSLQILRTSRSVRHDPTVLGAEIAISEAFSRRSRNKKLGKQLAHSKNFHPFFISELAGTVGTLEANHGSKRRAREALTASAECPTENSLAQLEWISPRLHVEIEYPEHCATQPFEAQTYAHFQNRDYRRALSAAVGWAEYQPLTSRPALTASHLASVHLNDYDTAIRVLQNALMYSPSSFGLRNNLAFALASSGRLEEAKEEMGATAGLELKSSEEGVCWATKGLLAFRTGDHEEGRRLYRRAEQHFSALRDRSRLAMAKVFHAREELLSSTRESIEIALDALETARTTGLEDIEALEYIERKVKKGTAGRGE